MNLIFMGTPCFAVPVLDALIKSRHNILAVVTQPDRSKGRSKKLIESPVKALTTRNKLKLLQPENINKDEKIICLLEKLLPDVIITAAFGQIVSKRILSIPKYDCINIHTSLLPKYRGAAPINRAIINGEDETGVSIIKMAEAMDAGDIIKQDVTKISLDEDAEDIANRLSSLAVKLLLNVIDSYEENSVKYIQQNEKLVTYANKLEKDDGIINWKSDSKTIHNLVRGLIPWPCAYSYLQKTNASDKKRLIIKKTYIDDDCKTNDNNKQPGTINKTSEKGLLVATCDGSIWITRVQPEGKRIMDARDYINGYNISVGDCFISL
ncbi:MAG: methionyl-tRNA formyltransferase [Candidatus Anammoxibacter sp.]